jgi:hypothetical protein
MVCRASAILKVGLELRVEHGTELYQSQVCKTLSKAHTQSEEWRTALVEKGWRE